MTLINNFGLVYTDPNAIDSSYNGFGVINSSLTGLTNVTNTVTDSTTASSISSGQITGQVTSVAGYLQSANFKTGVSGWFISADGTCEFSSGYFRGDITGASGTFSGTLSAATITGSSISGGSISGTTISGATITGTTIIGGTIETSSGSTRVVLDSSTNSLLVYYGGNVTTQLYQSGIQFNTVLGVASAAVQGFGSNDLMITIAGSSAEYHLRTDDFYQDSGASLGATNPWNILYVNSITLNGVNRSTWPSAGATTLSGLTIDTSKNWGGYSITNLGGVSSTTGSFSSTLTISASQYIDFGSGAYLNNPTVIYLANRTTYPGATAGAMCYRSDLGHFYGYTGGSWKQLDN